MSLDIRLLVVSDETAVSDKSERVTLGISDPIG
jgi:hypothetical protein